jgi:hypothetical protein
MEWTSSLCPWRNLRISAHCGEYDADHEDKHISNLMIDNSLTLLKRAEGLNVFRCSGDLYTIGGWFFLLPAPIIRTFCLGMALTVRELLDPSDLPHLPHDLFANRSPALRIVAISGVSIGWSHMSFIRALHDLDLGGSPLYMEGDLVEILRVLSEATELRIFKLRAEHAPPHGEITTGHPSSFVLPRLEKLHLKVCDNWALPIYQALWAPKLREYVDDQGLWFYYLTSEQGINFIMTAISNLQRTGSSLLSNVSVSAMTPSSGGDPERK